MRTVLTERHGTLVTVVACATASLGVGCNSLLGIGDPESLSGDAATPNVGAAFDAATFGLGPEEEDASTAGLEPGPNPVVGAEPGVTPEAADAGKGAFDGFAGGEAAGGAGEVGGASGAETGGAGGVAAAGGAGEGGAGGVAAAGGAGEGGAGGVASAGGAGEGGAGGVASAGGAGEGGADAGVPQTDAAADAGPKAACGNGILEDEELCDDHNVAADDGCSAGCQREPGYACEQVNGASQCTNLDECASGTDDCDLHATCTDTEGSFTCECNPGYAGTGDTCAPLSCTALPASCGIDENDDCCATLPVTGGMFAFGPTEANLAVVSTFELDKYEVTVGRFRQFLSSYDGLPPLGGGAHPLIQNSGWRLEWDDRLGDGAAALSTDVQCDAVFQTWDSTGAGDRLPMNCLSWYAAFAFCAWDGGRLPTEIEWEYAAAGGAQERPYPWGDALPTSTLAVYDCTTEAGAERVCSFDDILPVGSKPVGAGRYGQVDLAGSVSEWVFDWYQRLSDFPDGVVDYALTEQYEHANRSHRGGEWFHNASSLPVTTRESTVPQNASSQRGVRCARDPER